MVKKILLIISISIVLVSCNKLRIRDIPAEEDGPDIYNYHTSQTNYHRNSTSTEEIAPPLSEVWDESFTALPSKGFTLIDDWMFFGTTNGYVGAANIEDGKQRGKKNMGDACPVPRLSGKILFIKALNPGNMAL